LWLKLKINDVLGAQRRIRLHNADLLTPGLLVEITDP